MLLELDDANYLSIYPWEAWLINYWIGDYEAILNGMRSYDSAFSSTIQTRVQPSSDYLFYKLKEQTVAIGAALKKEIISSSYDEEKKEILTLNFVYLISESDSDGENQHRLNSLSNSFLDSYPDSNFEKYVREYIRYELRPSKWGFSFEFFSGFGIFTEELKNDFTNNIPIGVAFDIFYKNYILFLRNYIGFSKTTNEIAFDEGTWKDDAQVRVFLPEASVGYLLLDSKKVKFMPFVGISSTTVSPTEYDLKRFEEYDNVGLDFTTTYSYGINLDFVIGTSDGIPIVSRSEQSYWFIRLRYAYNQPQFQKKYDGFGGDFHYITLGFGGFGRKLKRDY